MWAEGLGYRAQYNKPPARGPPRHTSNSLPKKPDTKGKQVYVMEGEDRTEDWGEWSEGGMDWVDAEEMEVGEQEAFPAEKRSAPTTPEDVMKRMRTAMGSTRGSSGPAHPARSNPTFPSITTSSSQPPRRGP